MSSRADRTPRAALEGIGLALAAPAALLLPTLPAGGLAPLVVAAVVAMVLAVPAALLEWRTPPPQGPASRALGATVADLIALGAVAATLAPWVAGAGWLGVVVLAGGWGAAWALARRSVVWQLAPAGLALGLALVAGALALLGDPRPYTLLTPTWSTWPLWVGPAAVAGLWIGGVGHGQWSFGVRRRPGQVHAPWAGPGAATLLVLGLAVHVAGRLEGSAGGSFDALTAAVIGLAAVSAGAVGLAREGDARPRVALGALATAWLAWPAAAITTVAWSALMPVAMAGAAGLVAVRQDRSQRPLSVVVIAMLLGAAFLGWPGVPGGVLDAVALGVTLTAGFWVVATRAAVASVQDGAS